MLPQLKELASSIGVADRGCPLSADSYFPSTVPYQVHELLSTYVMFWNFQLITSTDRPLDTTSETRVLLFIWHSTETRRDFLRFEAHRR